MAGIEEVITNATLIVFKAHDADTIDETVYYGNKAIFEVLCALLREISGLRVDLAKIQNRDFPHIANT